MRAVPKLGGTLCIALVLQVWLFLLADGAAGAISSFPFTAHLGSDRRRAQDDASLTLRGGGGGAAGAGAGASICCGLERGGRQRPRQTRHVLAQKVPRGGGCVNWKRIRGPSRENVIEGLKNGVASGLAAACVKALLQPFDAIKTVQQYSRTPMTLAQAARVLLARGGPRALYTGLGVSLVGSMPAVGVYFGIYQFCKRQLDQVDWVNRQASIAVSAGIGNFVATFFRVPQEIVKQRLQAGVHPNTAVAIASIYQKQGLLGFFGKSGLATQMARDIPYAMITLLVYESLQTWSRRRRADAAAATVAGGGVAAAVPFKASPFETMFIGAVAGGIGSLLTNPMDVIKTRIMTSPEVYSGAMDAVWTTLRVEGPLAFLKGATPRLLHKIPANGAFFVAYEFFRALLGVNIE
ncbi:unnamed protein product [Phaeothamnion confervicola]